MLSDIQKIGDSPPSKNKKEKKQWHTYAQDIGDNYSSVIHDTCHMTSFVDGLVRKRILCR